VPDAAGRMSKVDPSLRPSARDGRLEPATTLSPVSFSPSAGAADLIRLDLGDGVSGRIQRRGCRRGDSVGGGRHSDLPRRPDRCGCCVVGDHVGMKDEIVLRSLAAPMSWVFPLRTVGGDTAVVG